MAFHSLYKYQRVGLALAVLSPIEDDEKKNGQSKQSSSSSTHSVSTNEIKVFCPKCDTVVSHTAEGIEQDQIKALIAKVYHYFEQEYEELKMAYEGLELTPLSKFGHRTALATGVSETMVLEVLQEEERRNAEAEKQVRKRGRRRKRPRQTESSNDDTDDIIERVVETSCGQDAIQREVIVDDYQHQQQTQGNIESTRTRPRSGAAERQRRYRERRKADKMNACTSFSESSAVQPQQGEPQHEHEKNKRQSQSNAERQRKYRKLLREQKLREQREDINGITSRINQLKNVDPAELERKRLLNKLRQSRFRARQRFQSPTTSPHKTQTKREPEVDALVVKVKVEPEDCNNMQSEIEPISLDVKLEPPDNKTNDMQSEIDPISLDVKVEPPDNKTNESSLLEEL